MTLSTAQSHIPKSQQWYRPTVSPEHGVYVVLLVSFITGAAAAQQWAWATTLALICAFCGFQAEHPLVLQIKQRRSWKPQFLVWTSIYGGVAIAISLWLMGQTQSWLPLLLIYSGAIAAGFIDGILVWRRQQKSIPNELITFTAVCLSAPLAYTVTTGTISTTAIALWLLNAVFFSSTIFTVKLRKTKTASAIPGVVFHSIATVLVLTLWLVGWLPAVTASAFGVAGLKFMLILGCKDWYCTTKIQRVALLETTASFLFLVIASLPLLPAHLPVN
jgi:hypothetical protein